MALAQSIADQLRAILDQAKADGATDDEIVTLLQTLTADLTWDASVLEHSITDLSVRLSMVQSELDARIAALQSDLDAGLANIVAILVGPPAQPPAASVLITLQGGTVPNVSIDDTTGKATFEWVDDHGDTDALPPTSADGGPITVTLGSDNPAVATLAADASDATGRTFDITPVAEGTANVVLTAVDDQGNPATFVSGPSAGQPITAAPSPFTVVAGAASGLTVQVAP